MRKPYYRVHMYMFCDQGVTLHELSSYKKTKLGVLGERIYAAVHGYKIEVWKVM